MEATQTQETELTISMRDFFALPEVIAAQSVQKQNPYGSFEHRMASSAILLLADKHNCGEYFA
jgi:hypothetical protein